MGLNKKETNNYKAVCLLLNFLSKKDYFSEANLLETSVQLITLKKASM